MASDTPTKGALELERLRLELNIAELELSVRRMAVRRAEIQEELARIAFSEDASRKAIEDVRLKLTGLQGSIQK